MEHREGRYSQQGCLKPWAPEEREVRLWSRCCCGSSEELEGEKGGREKVAEHPLDERRCHWWGKKTHASEPKIANTWAHRNVQVVRNKAHVFVMNLPDRTDSNLKRRRMRVVQSSFHISRMVPLMMAVTTIDKEKED